MSRKLKEELLAEYATSLEKYSCFSVKRHRNGGFTVKIAPAKRKTQSITQKNKTTAKR